MAITWVPGSVGFSAVGTSTTGNEAGPPAAGDGLPTEGLAGMEVTVEAGGAMAATALQIWIWNPISAAWMRANDSDQTIQAQAKQAFRAFPIPDAIPGGRICALPLAAGISCTVYMFGAHR
jgi:hypothetical protein